MASPASPPPQKPPIIPITIGLVVVLVAIGAVLYFARPTQNSGFDGPSAEAKAYLPYLALSDVSMEASENFMKQQVVEVKGTIADNGPKALQSVDVYCVFYDTRGQEIHRERLPIVAAKSAPLRPGEKRAFRLPFDTLPDGWNQAMPRLVIAQIRFAP
jgi:hypothetical protein